MKDFDIDELGMLSNPNVESRWENILKKLKEIPFKKPLKFEVWLEGYKATGESRQAEFLGIHEASSFQEACKNAIKEWQDEFYDEENNSYWGCGFFDNEIDARERFG